MSEDTSVKIPEFTYSDVRKEKFCSLFPDAKKVKVVLGNTSAAYCIKFLKEEQIHSVPVLEKVSTGTGTNKVLGLVDVMDICALVTRAYLARANDEVTTTMVNFRFIIENQLANFMATDLIDISDNNHLKLLKAESATFYEILDTLSTTGYSRVLLLGSRGLFESKYKRPIERIVTRSDILKFVVEKSVYYDFHVILNMELSVVHDKTHELILLADSSPTIEAFRLMLAHNLHALPVVNGDRLIGNLSVRDVEASFSDSSAALYSPISEYLVKVRSANSQSPAEVVTAKMNDSVRHAINLMTQKKIHRVWIVNDSGKPIGVFSATDVCRLFARSSKYLGVNRK